MNMPKNNGSKREYSWSGIPLHCFWEPKANTSTCFCIYRQLALPKGFYLILEGVKSCPQQKQQQDRQESLAVSLEFGQRLQLQSVLQGSGIFSSVGAVAGAAG